MKNRVLLFVFLMLGFSISKSVGQTTGYVSVPDSVNLTEFNRMIHTSDGGFISLSISGPSQSFRDVIKWDANFHSQWSKQFGATAIFLWNGVIETNDGNFIAMGTNQNNINSTVCIKMNAAGTILWQKEYHIASNSLTSFAISKAAGTDPGYIFGGGQCGATNYLVRCDAAGTILWQNNYYVNGASGAQTIPVIKPGSSNYIITGYGIFNSDIDAYIMNIDSSGSLHWCQRIVEPVLNQVPASCQRLQNGNYAMICGCNGNPNYDQIVYYFDSLGNISNGIKLSNPTNQEITLFDFAEVNNGRIILNGYISSAPGAINYLYMELDANGSIVWQKTAGAISPTSTNAMGKTISKTSNNLYALGGDGYADGKTITVIDSTGSGFCSTANGAIVSQASEAFTVNLTAIAIVPLSIIATPINNTANAPLISTITLCGTTGLSEIEKNELQLNVFPNPAQHEITLDFGDLNFAKAVVTFYNVLGENVFSSMIVKGNAQVDISKLNAGVYVMEVLVGGTVIKKKIVKN